MDHALHTRIVAAAASSGHWQTADIIVKTEDEMHRNGCTFLYAYNSKLRDSFALHYALMPDGRLAGVDLSGNAAATALLRACGQQADANWWAEVVTRFSNEAGAMPVTADSSPRQIEKVRNAGGDFRPPTLIRGEGVSRLEFFSLGVIMPAGDYFPLQINATLPDQGELTVTVKNLRTGASR